jgi:hypothetical protein
MTLTRRVLLMATTALGLAPAAASTELGEAAARLKHLARPQESARALGLVYLARRPEEAGNLRLARRVLAALGLDTAGLASLDDRRLESLLAARARADFAAGEVESVAGWRLARTEVLLLALAV